MQKNKHPFTQKGPASIYPARVNIQVASNAIVHMSTRPFEASGSGPLNHEIKTQGADTIGQVGSEYSHQGFKGNLKTPNNNCSSTGKNSSDLRSMTEVRPNLRPNGLIEQAMQFSQAIQNSLPISQTLSDKKQTAPNGYQQFHLDNTNRSNSSMERQLQTSQSRAANGGGVYKGVLGFSKSREFKHPSNGTGRHQQQDPSTKLPTINGQSASLAFRALQSPTNAGHSEAGNKSLIISEAEQLRYPGSSVQNKFAKKKISQSSSSSNVKLIKGYSPAKAQPPQTLHLDPASKLKHKLVSDQFNFAPSDFLRPLDLEEEEEDDDDFQKGAPIEDQFLDNLDYNGKPYEYVDDEPFEDDDEVTSNENIVLEEEESEVEAESQKTQSGFTHQDLAMGGSSSSNMTKHTSDMGVGGSANTETKKEFRVKKKKSILKKKQSAKSKKSDIGGYREDAEENKTWCQDSQSAFSSDIPSASAQKGQVELNYAKTGCVVLAQDAPALAKSASSKPTKIGKEEFLLRPPNPNVILIKSMFNKRTPYIYFPYPSSLKMQRPIGSELQVIRMTQEDLKPYSMLGFKINSSTHTYNCVVNSLKVAGFRLVSGSAWNCLWTGLIKPSKLKFVNQYQKINHFPGAWHLGRKDNLWRNVFKMKRQHGQDYNIAPPTYIFPEDYKRWINERETSGFKHMYIMKPTASSCGRGIRVIGKKQHVSKKSGYLVSKYLSKPHLLRGFKYDLRIYVLVTCFDPLRIYLFEEGLVRMATQPYNTGKSSLSKRFIHLTNFSVNKKATNYVSNQNSNIEAAGAEAPNASKWCLKQLRAEYQKMGVDFNAVFEQIKDVIIKTIISVEQHIVTNMKQTKHRNACFELYGFDIILDQSLKPWLLEVNVCPSLSSSSPLDKQIKTMLLSDVLYLVGFQIYDRKKLEKDQERIAKQRLLGFDAQQKKQAPKKIESAPTAFSPSKSSHSYSSSTSSPDRNRRMIEMADSLTEEDYDVLADLEEENMRRGHFSRIFPLASNIDTYSKYFECSRHMNQVVWNYLKMGSPINLVKAHFK